ncbi:MAG: sugar-binding transcriptional regulator [bacterium]
MPLHEDLYRLLYKIAQAYYLDGLTQQQIAKRFNLSRPKVSRLLQQARDEKIVNITLVPPSGSLAGLENTLEDQYGLDEVILVPVSDPADTGEVARRLGPPAGEYLLRSLHDHDTLALAWGTTLSAAVNALPCRSWNHLTIVQMIGGLGPDDSNEHSAELVRRAARRLQAQFRLVRAPGIVATTAAAKALRADPQIADTLEHAARADFALVGLGVLSPGTVLRQSGTILGENDLALLKQSGAAGDIILRFLDEQGAPLGLDINKRIIGLTLEQLKKIPRVAGVAGGTAKYKIIRAALRGRWLNVLITDQQTGERLAADRDG